MRRLPATLIALPLPCTRSATITDITMPPTPIAMMAISDSARPNRIECPNSAFQSRWSASSDAGSTLEVDPGEFACNDGEIPLLLRHGWMGNRADTCLMLNQSITKVIDTSLVVSRSS
jgi:hypothetical protein